MKNLVIIAPNWLGDAVMALPAIGDVRRAQPEARITVAARPNIAPLFAMTPDVDDTIELERRGWREAGDELARRQFDVALLLPNSLHAALVASRARIPERWGYRRDLRGLLLTSAIVPPSGLHQVEYYQQLVHALGFPNGPIEPRIVVPQAAIELARTKLEAAGWRANATLAAMAPGAAYGGAKRWPPASFAELALDLARDGIQTVIVGSDADRPTTSEVRQTFAARRADTTLPIVDLVGETTLASLAGVFALSRVLVTNDSGAMHLAAAAGTRVTAVFGPTDERITRPMSDASTVVTGPAWCRPCLLRECPLDHRCMRGIGVAVVAAAARSQLNL